MYIQGLIQNFCHLVHGPQRQVWKWKLIPGGERPPPPPEFNFRSAPPPWNLISGAPLPLESNFFADFPSPYFLKWNSPETVFRDLTLTKIPLRFWILHGIFI